MKYYKPVNYPITQGFGVENTLPSMLPFYQSLGLKGHNGIDFGCPTGTKCYWYGSDKGLLIGTGVDNLGGNYCTILTKEDNKTFIHRFYHLQEVIAKIGQELETGDLLAITDNTGKGTTGAHLHALDIKEVIPDKNGNWQTVNKDNGYLGEISPYDKFQDIFVLDYIETLQKEIGILHKLILMISDFLKGN
jgi:murein DD-endopeptidase MepM/ murein hydrolase activator NlpD